MRRKKFVVHETGRWSTAVEGVITQSGLLSYYWFDNGEIVFLFIVATLKVVVFNKPSGTSSFCGTASKIHG